MALAVLSAFQTTTSTPPTEAAYPAVPMATTPGAGDAAVKLVMLLVPPALGRASTIVQPAISGITHQHSTLVQPVIRSVLPVLVQAAPNAPVAPLGSIQSKALLRTASTRAPLWGPITMPMEASADHATPSVRHAQEGRATTATHAPQERSNLSIPLSRILNTA